MYHLNHKTQERLRNMQYFLKQSILSIPLVFIFGCGVMSKPKEEKEAIHIPNNIFVKIPNALKSKKEENYKSTHYQKAHWYK